MSIRVYKKADYPTILKIYADSKLDELRFEANTFEFMPLERDVKRREELFESEIFVFDADGVVAYGALFCGANTRIDASVPARPSEIRAVCVSPSARAKGIGKQLLQYLIDKCPGDILLSVAESNKPAITLYQSYGFVTTKTFETDYNGAPVVASEMCLRRSL